MAQEKILVVDDQRDELALLELRLKRCGYMPLLAGSAAKALQLLEKSTVDLILCDYRMPRMDGLAFLAEVKARYPGIPFVMMTGHGGMEKAMATLNEGAFDYLEKQFNMDDLFDTIRRALEYGKTGKQLRC